MQRAITDRDRLLPLQEQWFGRSQANVYGFGRSLKLVDRPSGMRTFPLFAVTDPSAGRAFSTRRVGLDLARVLWHLIPTGRSS
jgi:hypothetical protein